MESHKIPWFQTTNQWLASGFRGKAFSDKAIDREICELRKHNKRYSNIPEKFKQEPPSNPVFNNPTKRYIKTVHAQSAHDSYPPICYMFTIVYLYLWVIVKEKKVCIHIQ